MVGGLADLNEEFEFYSKYDEKHRSTLNSRKS